MKHKDCLVLKCSEITKKDRACIKAFINIISDRLVWKVKVEILGCSGGIGKGLKTTTFLVDDSLLLDAGTGVELLTSDQMLKIRTVLITHAHIDHIAGLPLMLATIYDRHKHKIDVYALPSVISALRKHIFNWDIWPDYTRLPPDSPILSMHELNIGDELVLEGKEVVVLPSNHPSPTAGYIIKSGNRSFAFTGDTGINDQLAPLLNQHQPEVFIVDVSFTNEMDELAKLSGHLTPNGLKHQIDQLNYSPAIYLTHLKPGHEEAIIKEATTLVKEVAPLSKTKLLIL